MGKDAGQSLHSLHVMSTDSVQHNKGSGAYMLVSVAQLQACDSKLACEQLCQQLRCWQVPTTGPRVNRQLVSVGVAVLQMFEACTLSGVGCLVRGMQRSLQQHQLSVLL